MRKFLSLLLCLILGVSLVGCLDETTPDTTTPEDTTTPDTTTPDTTTPEVPEATATLQDVLDVLNADSGNATMTMHTDYFMMMEEMYNTPQVEDVPGEDFDGIEVHNESVNELYDFSDFYGTFVMEVKTYVDGHNMLMETTMKTCLDEFDVDNFFGDTSDITILTDNNGGRVFTEMTEQNTFMLEYENFYAAYIIGNEIYIEEIDEDMDLGFNDGSDEQPTLLPSHFELIDGEYVLTAVDMVEYFGNMEIVLADKIEDCVVNVVDYDSEYSMSNFGTTTIELFIETEIAIVVEICNHVGLSLGEDADIEELFGDFESLLLKENSDEKLEGLISIMNQLLDIRAELNTETE